MNYYDYTDDYPIHCPHCGWKGTKKDTDKVPFEDCLLLVCPQVDCDRSIMTIHYPTPEDTRESAQAGNPWARIDHVKNVLADQFNRDWDKAVDLVKTKIQGHRKGLPNAPAHEHSIRVGELVRNSENATPDMALAALLHDIVEDGGVNLTELGTLGFSAETIRLVDLCSHDSSIKDSDVRWVCMVARLAQANDPDAWKIKLADIYDNLDESDALELDRKKFMWQVKAPLLLKLSETSIGNSEIWKMLKEKIQS